MMNDIERSISLLRHGIAKPGYAKDRQVRKAMLLLLTAATESTTNIPRLIELTELPAEFVAEVADRMRAAGEWTGVDSREWLDGSGTLKEISLINLALVGLGDERRLKSTDACALEGLDDKR